MSDPVNDLLDRPAKMKLLFPDDVPTKCSLLLIHLQEFQNYLILMLKT